MTVEELREALKDVPGGAEVKLWVQQEEHPFTDIMATLGPKISYNSLRFWQPEDMRFIKEISLCDE